MNKYTVHTKSNPQQEPLYVAILAAGIEYRSKGKGNKSLTYLGHETVLEHQLKTIRHTFPHAITTVIAGFEADKVIKLRQAETNIIENQLYESLGVAEDIRLYLNSCWPSRVLFIDGAVSFCSEAVRSLIQKPSVFVYQTNDTDQVGVYIENGRVINFSYGLSTAFSGLCYLEATSLSILKKIVNKENGKLLFSELLNMLIDKNVGLTTVSNNKAEIVRF